MTILNQKKKARSISRFEDHMRMVQQCFKTGAVLVRTKDGDKAEWVKLCREKSNA